MHFPAFSGTLAFFSQVSKPNGTEEAMENIETLSSYLYTQKRVLQNYQPVYFPVGDTFGIYTIEHHNPTIFDQIKTALESLGIRGIQVVPDNLLSEEMPDAKELRVLPHAPGDQVLLYGAQTYEKTKAWLSDQFHLLLEGADNNLAEALRPYQFKASHN